MDSRASGLLLDSLVNQEAVRNHAHEAQEVARYGSARLQWVAQSVESQKALSALHLGQGAIIAAGVGAIMVFAGLQALQGHITVGDLVLLNAYVIQICLPLNALGFLFREARDAQTHLETLRQLLAWPPEVQDGPLPPSRYVWHGTGGQDYPAVTLSITKKPGQRCRTVPRRSHCRSRMARWCLSMWISPMNPAGRCSGM